jgi:hypothetical protein
MTINKLCKLYEKQIERIVKGVARGTKKSVRWLDDLQQSKDSIQRMHEDYVKTCNLTYPEECNLIQQGINALDDIDKKHFGEKNIYGMVVGYDFYGKMAELVKNYDRGKFDL